KTRPRVPGTERIRATTKRIATRPLLTARIVGRAVSSDRLGVLHTDSRVTQSIQCDWARMICLNCECVRPRLCDLLHRREAGNGKRETRAGAEVNSALQVRDKVVGSHGVLGTGKLDAFADREVICLPIGIHRVRLQSIANKLGLVRFAVTLTCVSHTV